MSRVEEDPGEDIEDSERSKNLAASNTRMRTARRDSERPPAVGYHPEDRRIISLSHKRVDNAPTFAEDDRSESSGNMSSDEEQRVRSSYKAEVRVVRLFGDTSAAGNTEQNKSLGQEQPEKLTPIEPPKHPAEMTDVEHALEYYFHKFGFSRNQLDTMAEKEGLGSPSLDGENDENTNSTKDDSKDDENSNCMPDGKKPFISEVMQALERSADGEVTKEELEKVVVQVAKEQGLPADRALALVSKLPLLKGSNERVMRSEIRHALEEKIPEINSLIDQSRPRSEQTSTDKVLQHLELNGGSEITTQALIQSLTEIAFLNGRSIETEEESKKVRELAAKIMSGNSRLSLPDLRKALDKNGCDLEGAVEIKHEESDVVN